MKLIFIHIPKTAGTSIRESFNITVYDRIPEFENNVFSQYFYEFCRNNERITFAHVDFSMLPVPKNDTYRFCFVRNPYDRAVSCFLHYGVLNNQFHGIAIKEKKNLRLAFTEFCELILKGIEPIGLENINGLNYCNPQYKWIEYLDMNFIGEVEMIEEDIEKIPFDHKPLNHLNSRRVLDIKDYYTDETTEMVREYYKEDFKRFNYKR
jgi:hypothetical protein